MKKKYVVEIILFISYVLFAMSWVACTQFMGNIMKDMGVSGYTAASFLSTVLTFAKIIGTAVAAWTVIKLGLRNAVTMAGILMCVSILTPYAPNYPILLISRFLVGLGGALLIVYFNPIVFKLFAAKERPVINGMNAIAFNLGTALMMYLGGSMMEAFSTWRGVLTALSLVSVLMLILWLIFGTISEEKNLTIAAKEEDKYRFIDGLKEPFNWVFMLTYSGLLAFYIVLFTFYPQAGISQTKVVILMGIVGAICGMVYSSKYSKRIPIIRISGIIQLISIVALSFFNSVPGVGLASAIVLGFFLFFPMSAYVTLAQEQPGMTARKISVTFSIFWSGSYVMATIAPTIFAKIVDVSSGNFFYAFVFITALEASFFIGSFFLTDKK